MITQESNEIRSLAREFAAAELRPHVERWDHDRQLDAALLPQLSELGFLGMLAPEAHGGMGLDLVTYLAALEELAWGEAAVALTVATSTFVTNLLIAHGSSAQKSRWLEPLASGQMLGCYAVPEEHDAADAGAVPLRARRNGDGWILEGTQRWVTNGRTAHLAALAARTGEGSSSGTAIFLVPVDTDGFVTVSRETTLGFRPVEVVTVRLRGVAVSGENVLGAGDGETLDAALVTGRLSIAAIAVGIAQAALEHALSYANEREQFGQKLRNFQGIQFKLADMAMRTDAARTLLQDAAAKGSARAAACAKVLASETAMWVTTQAVQIFGGYGYMRDYPVEKLMRDAKGTELLEGSNELLRVLIARELYPVHDT